MSRREKLSKDFAILRTCLQIQNNAALVGIGIYKSQATFAIFNIASEWRQQPVRVTTWRFDLNDVGSQVSEQASRVRCGDITQFNDAEMTQGPGTFVLL